MWQHKLTKQLVDGSAQWIDAGDLHGTPWWCVLKDESSWGHSLPNGEALRGLLGNKIEWVDGSAMEDRLKDWIFNCSIEWVKTPWLYETPMKEGLFIREFRQADDPTQKCYIRELFVKGFNLDTVYRGGHVDSPCVDAGRSLVVMPFGDTAFEY